MKSVKIAGTDYDKVRNSYMKKLADTKEIRETEDIARFVFATMEQFAKRDIISNEELARTARQLLGASMFLGARYIQKRALSDVEQELAKNARDTLVNHYASDPKYTVTQARAMADMETFEISTEARITKMTAEQYEVYHDIANRAISLIQTIIRANMAEQYGTKSFE